MSGVSARRHTRVLPADAAGITEAAAILRAGGLVAFPTETVYGLGAHALEREAVRAIFEAKDRPANDPLIVHVASASEVPHVALSSPRAEALAQKFWPGPLTLVLPKRPNIPPEVTAGLDTVAVRVPAHPVAQALLRETGLPIAAPSANLFGRPSPTRAEHVLEDLEGRIDAILDGGATAVGVESTIVDVSSMPARLLRPGGVAVEDIEAAIGSAVMLGAHPTDTSGPQRAPGMLPMHYAPQTPLILIVGPPAAARDRLYHEIGRAVAADERIGVLLLEEDRARIPPGVYVEVVGAWADPRRSAARLFDALRALDAARLDVIIARELSDPAVGLGRALSDRLRRAARRVLDTQP
jgi:L-threonylcarbamoyladenylate synthase